MNHLKSILQKKRCNFLPTLPRTLSSSNHVPVALVGATISVLKLPMAMCLPTTNVHNRFTQPPKARHDL